MRNGGMPIPGTRSARGRLGFGRTGALPFAALIVCGLLLSDVALGQKIRVLEADTLRTSDRRDRGIEVIIDAEGDEDSPSVRIGPSRWKRGGDESSSLVRFGESIVIDVDEVVDGSVVAFGGDVIVRGRVLDDVVCFGGEVILEEGGIVEGDVAAFGGGIERAPGSELRGEEVDVAFVPTTFGGSFGGRGGGHAFWVLLTLSGFLFLGIAGLVTEWMLPFRVRRMVEHVRSSLWPSFFVGVAAQLLLGPAIALLCFTVIGIPVALLLPVVFAVAQIIGFLVVAAVIGAKFSDGSLETRPAWVRSVLVGVAALAGLTLISVLLAGIDGPMGSIGGFLLLSITAALWTISTIGLGALSLSRFGSRGPFSAEGDGPNDSVPDFTAGSPRTI